MNIEIEREQDGRWVVEVSDLLGVIAYRGTRENALANAEVIEWRVVSL